MMLKLLLLPILLIAVVVQAPANRSIAADLLNITGENVRLRRAPGADSAVISRLALGTEVVELGRSGEWVNVEVAGESRTHGWVHVSYVGFDPKTGSRNDCRGVRKHINTKDAAPVRWSSTLEEESNGTYCIVNTVEVIEDPFKALAHWPIAGIEDAFLNPRLSVKTNDDRLPRQTSGHLFCGFRNKQTETIVFSPIDVSFVTPNLYQQDGLVAAADAAGIIVIQQTPEEARDTSLAGPTGELWTTVDGEVLNHEGGESYFVSVTVRSWYRDVSEGGREQFEYGYKIANHGDGVAFQWSALDQPRARESSGIEQRANIYLKEKLDEFSTSFLSNTKRWLIGD